MLKEIETNQNYIDQNKCSTFPTNRLHLQQWKKTLLVSNKNRAAHLFSRIAKMPNHLVHIDFV